MNNDIIDLIGVSTLNRHLCYWGYMKPYLQTNDKRESWDGCIDVFSEQEELKSYQFRVPVQIKSKLNTGKTFDESTKHNVKVEDLRRYLIDGGVVYFKVIFKKNKEEQIYCKFLTVSKLESILESITPKDKPQKYTTIELKKITIDVKEFIKGLESIQNLSVLKPVRTIREINKEFSLK